MKKGTRTKKVDTPIRALTSAPEATLYDALILEIERADALIGHLEDRLSALHESDTALNIPELLALSVIAHEASDIQQRIRDRALALYEYATAEYEPGRKG